MDWHLYVGLTQQSAVAWIDDRAATMGAALAFYSAFALAPLLIFVIALADAVLGTDTARNALAGQLTALVGAPGAQAIQALLTGARGTSAGVIATTIGVLTMLVGATTVVVELQDDLDLIWKAPKRTGSGWLTMLRARMLSLGMILGIGFLLLISLVLNGALAALAALSEAHLPGATLVLLHTSTLVLSLGAATVLFAMLYKALPNVRIAWRDVWFGAFITAVLFNVGRFAIGLYLGRSALASAYGAAGTLVVLLLWLYYSAQIFLFGAEFTRVHASYRLTLREGARAPRRSMVEGSP